MNIINHLFDEQYVKELFKKEVLPLYSDFREIKRIKIRAPKKNIWETTYHVVIMFDTTFLTLDGKEKKLPIYCSAHSEEPRKNVYDSLKFLWDSSFSKGYLSIPHPLFYSKKFNGIFYRGVRGKHLYQYIRARDFEQIEQIVSKAAAWFAKLHNLSTENVRNFNPQNSRIETVVPGVEHILDRVSRDYPEYEKTYKMFYDKFIQIEKDFLSSTSERWLVHGDAHPENIIKMGKKKIGVIDFTDLCLSDFARDLGSFLQQLEFMCARKIKQPEYTEKINKVFLDNYLVNVTMNIDDEVFERINNYYNWTAIRTATYFLIMHNPEPERARPMIEKVKKNLNI